MFEKIFNRPELQSNPPVLVDIGASGALYPHWEQIAKYCICIAFDPDLREMKHLDSGTSPYRELFVHNSIVSAEKKLESNFYLTKSPYCSSTLVPAVEPSISVAPLFEIEKKVVLKTENLVDVLRAKNISHVDWFKTDSQGTDLRIFKSLGEETLRRVLIADLEPGIIDAYKGEDKAWHVLQFMDEKNFWMSDMRVMSVKKIPRNWKKLSNERDRTFRSGSADSPGWTEMSFISDGTQEDFDIREFLLLWVFATIKNQHGFAFDIATRGTEKFSDVIFLELETESEKSATRKQRYNNRTTKIMRFTNRLKKIVKKIL